MHVLKLNERNAIEQQTSLDTFCVVIVGLFCRLLFDYRDAADLCRTWYSTSTFSRDVQSGLQVCSFPFLCCACVVTTNSHMTIERRHTTRLWTWVNIDEYECRLGIRLGNRSSKCEKCEIVSQQVVMWFIMWTSTGDSINTTWEFDPTIRGILIHHPLWLPLFTESWCIGYFILLTHMNRSSTVERVKG